MLRGCSGGPWTVARMEAIRGSAHVQTSDRGLTSVIIPAYRADAVLSRQLAALAAQREAPRFEVVIADNGGNQALGAVLARHSGALDIRVVEANAAQGASYARNAGIRGARGNFLLFCDSDDVVGPHWVANGRRNLDACELWTGSVIVLDDSELEMPLADLWARLPDDSVWTAPVREQDDAPLPFLLGGNFGATRQAMASIGGFDQSFPVRGEDNDLAIRAQGRGIPVMVSKCTVLAVGAHGEARGRIARKDAYAHARLLARHGLWAESRFKPWYEEIGRVCGDTVRMLFMPARRDWTDLGLRWARTAGFAEGVLGPRILAHESRPRIGEGWRRRTRRIDAAGDEAPQASVVIPCFNAGAWIEEQLESLAAQRQAPSFEVVLADNGSTDDTAERALARRWPFPVTIVDATGFRSASHARNVGASVAEADYLLFCDADDVVGPLWVRALVDALDSGALAVQGAIHHERFNDADVRQAYGVGDAPDPGGDERVLPVRPADGFAGYVPTLPGGSFAVRKDDYLALGGMDPSYPGGAEETDFAWRLQRARGGEVVSAPSAWIDYRLKASPRALFRQQRIQQRGRMLLWMRNRRTTMNGPSARASALAVLRSALGAPAARATRTGRLSWAYRMGAHVGALEGMLRFRRPGGLPAPLRWASAPDGQSRYPQHETQEVP